MNRIKSKCFAVLPNRGTRLIVDVPGYALEVDGLTLAICKLRGKWGVYDPDSGLSGHRRFNTRKAAAEFALDCLSDPVALKRAKKNAGAYYKTRAALDAGNFIKFEGTKAEGGEA